MQYAGHQLRILIKTLSIANMGRVFLWPIFTAARALIKNLLSLDLNCIYKRFKSTLVINCGYLLKPSPVANLGEGFFRAHIKYMQCLKLIYPKITLRLKPF